jgi:hypothetical protein
MITSFIIHDFMAEQGSQAAPSLAGLAAWLSAGASVDVAAMMSNKPVGWPELTELAKDSKRAADAKVALRQPEHVFWPSPCLGLTLVGDGQ